MMQALVVAHACFGHNSFFKGNYLFRQWTEADAIIDYLVFARRYVMECEERRGEEAVEAVLAAVAEDKERMTGEAADVLYHLLVMLHARGVTLREVEALLETRTKKSGLEEKASRK